MVVKLHRFLSMFSFLHNFYVAIYIVHIFSQFTFNKKVVKFGIMVTTLFGHVKNYISYA